MWAEEAEIDLLRVWLCYANLEQAWRKKGSFVFRYCSSSGG